MWVNGDLTCECGAVFQYAGPRSKVLNAARSRGWHLYSGASLTGKRIESHLCPDCIGTARSAKPRVERMVEDEPLF